MTLAGQTRATLPQTVREKPTLLVTHGHYRLLACDREVGFALNSGPGQRPSACLKRATSRHRSKQRYLSGSLAVVGEAAVAIECETEMRS